MVCIMVLLTGFLSFTGASGAICYPGENLWQMTKDICSIIEPCCSTLDSTASVIEGCCSVVDGTFSVVEDISSVLDSCCSVVESTFSVVESTASVLDDCCSVVEGTFSVVEDISSAFESCCSVIESTSSVVENTASVLDDCCSVVEGLQDCLVGTAITQADMPYIVPGPGNYYLCESVTTSGAPAITIAANDVYLNLNGHTITNLDNRGIVCSDFNNVQILNGVITSALEAIVVDGGSSYINIHDIYTFNTALTGIYIDSAFHITVKDCVCQNTNGTVIQVESGMVHVSDSSYVDIMHVIVRQTIGIGFFINAAQNTVCVTDCMADACEIYGFIFIAPAGPAQEAALVKNCTAQFCGNGFALQNLTDITICNSIASQCGSLGYQFVQCVGGVAENCIATSNTTGFALNCNELTLSHCISTSNSTDGFFIPLTSLNNVLDGCLASRNGNAGITNNTATTFIIDTRSSNTAATSDNPPYQLNSAPDVFSGATVIVTS